MNRGNLKLLRLMMLIGGVCSMVVGAPLAHAKSNVSEELWEERLMISNSVEAIQSEPAEESLSQQPIMIDVLDLKNMDILDVLKLISKKSGLNIVAGQNVKGQVTVFLKNVEVTEVLSIIVEAYGWAYVKDGDIVRVMTDKEFEAKHGHQFGKATETRIKQLTHAEVTDVVSVLNEMKSPFGQVIAVSTAKTLILTDEPAKLNTMEKIIRQMDMPVASEVFTLSYALVADLSVKIEEMLTPAIGSIKIDERSNKIMVSDTTAKIREIEKMIQAFDEKDKEVLIEAKIMQIGLSDEFKLGIDWEAVISEYHGLTVMNDFDVLGASDKSGKVSIGTLDTDNYTALVEALESVGETKILSSPRVMVINNEEAKILVGSTEPYVTTTTTTPSAGPTTTAESVNFIEVGVKLFVTPTIHEDNFITMKIKPEVSSVTSNLTTSNNNTIPIVETSEAETTVNVKDGVSIVIGGLIKEESIKSTRRVPFLGSIPVLGAAFRSKNDSVSNTEIVIFLTPRIVTGDVGEPDQLAAFRISGRR